MKNKWVLITGATSGIGLEIARALAIEGSNLVLCGRRAERLNEIKDEFKGDYGVNIETLCFDIQNKKDVLDTFTHNRDILAKVSILINNAGVAKGVDGVDIADPEDWDQMIDTNIKGLLYVTRYLLPHLKAQDSADIINIGSISGRWTYPGGSVYCGTKHAVRAISEGIRQDLCGQNIRVCCIEPGLVETEFSIVRLGDKDKADAVYAGMTPLSAKDIAESALWTLMRPKHVNIQELIIFPTAQAAITQVHRES